MRAGPGTLPAIVADACARLDPSGRFRPSDADRVRRALADHRRAGGWVEHPEELFGPWERLPEPVRNALRSLSERDLSARMDRHPGRSAHVRAVRFTRELDRWLADRRLLGRLRPTIYVTGTRLWLWPLRIRDGLVHRLRLARWRRARHPCLEDLVAAAGHDPQWLMGDFVDRARVDPRCRGFWHDAERNVAYAYLLGADIALTEEGAVCYETNLNPGLTGEVRSRVYERDPLAVGLAAFAERHGFRHVVWIAGQVEIDPWFYARLLEESAARGVRFTALDDARLPARRDIPEGLPVPDRCVFPPLDPPRDTLVVRIRGFRMGSDRVVSEKDAFSRCVTGELARSGETRVKVDPLTPEPGDVRLPQDPGLPNVVYKYPVMNRGVGVFFLRARDSDHAVALARDLDRKHGERPGRFQPWRASLPLPDRRAFEFRSMLLVSPLGSEWLGALRCNTASPLPERIPEGVVQDVGPFSRTRLYGNDYFPLEPEDVEPVREATLALGECLERVLRRGFVTGP